MCLYLLGICTRSSHLIIVSVAWHDPNTVLYSGVLSCTQKSVLELRGIKSVSTSDVIPNRPRCLVDLLQLLLLPSALGIVNAERRNGLFKSDVNSAQFGKTNLFPPWGYCQLPSSPNLPCFRAEFMHQDTILWCPKIYFYGHVHDMNSLIPFSIFPDSHSSRR